MTTPLSAPVSDQPTARPQTRRRARKLGPEAFDIVIEKLPRPKGSKGPHRSLSEKKIIGVLNAALKLKPWAVRQMLSMIKANDKAIAENRRKFASYYANWDPNDFDDSEFSDPGNANPALVILGIASIAKRGASDGSPPLVLEPWAVEEGLRRYGSRRWMHPEDRAAIKRLTRKDGEAYAPWTDWPTLPQPESRKPDRPKGPSFEAMKFEPGESGNSRGRPRATQYDVPFPYLLKKGKMMIDGVEYEVTGAQAFVYHVTKAEFPRNSSLPELISKTMIDVTKERWERPPTELAKEPAERTPGQLDFSQGLELLFLARKLNRMRAGRRMVIEPWVVQRSLGYLEEQHAEPLSLIEQKIVVDATRTAWKVNWPAWWEADIPSRRSKAQ